MKAKTPKTGRKITRKQKTFADLLLENPKLSATQAAIQAYGKPGQVLTPEVGNAIASENLRKPSVLHYMNAYSDRAQARIIELVESGRQEIALAASKDVLDRVHGKPTQKQEIEKRTISVSFGFTNAQISKNANE